MKYLGYFSIVIFIALCFVFSGSAQRFGGTVLSTVTSDTLETFRTNVNSSLASLNGTLAATTTSNTWAGNQTFTNAISVGTSTATALLNVGPSTANGSTTISAGKLQFDMYSTGGVRTCGFVLPSGVFATSTGACNL